MSFVQAIRTCFKKYATFNGVASRSEYWWFALFVFLVALVLDAFRIPALSVLWSLGTLCPNIAVSIRRMHDSGHSGWWILFPVVNLVFFCFPTKTGDNKYAADGTFATVTEASLGAGTGSSSCPVCGKLRLPGQNYCTGCGHQFTDAP
jgi:uncharacterized membrane protein YhaH (DUF805 family)